MTRCNPRENKKRQNNGTVKTGQQEGGETESWGDRQADMRCHAPCRGPWKKRSSAKRHNVSVHVNAGDTGEACTTRGRLAAKMTDPFESRTIQSEVSRFRKSHLCVSLDFWVVHLFIPHMHTFTVQGCPVCKQRLCLHLKVGGQMASTLAAIDCKLQSTRAAPSVSGVTL